MCKGAGPISSRTRTLPVVLVVDIIDGGDGGVSDPLWVFCEIVCAVCRAPGVVCERTGEVIGRQRSCKAGDGVRGRRPVIDEVRTLSRGGDEEDA